MRREKREERREKGKETIPSRSLEAPVFKLGDYSLQCFSPKSKSILNGATNSLNDQIHANIGARTNTSFFLKHRKILNKESTQTPFHPKLYLEISNCISCQTRSGLTPVKHSSWRPSRLSHSFLSHGQHSTGFTVILTWPGPIG